MTEIYTADPSAHVFGGRLYVYPSHDIEAGVPQDDLGSHFAMRDYRVLSLDTVGGPVTVHDVALDIENVPWARRQIFYHDSQLSGGRTHLRNVKVTELKYQPDGSIVTIDAYSDLER